MRKRGENFLGRKRGEDQKKKNQKEKAGEAVCWPFLYCLFGFVVPTFAFGAF